MDVRLPTRVPLAVDGDCAGFPWQLSRFYTGSSEFPWQFGKTLRDSSEAVVVLADMDFPEMCACRAVTAYISSAQWIGWG